MHTNLSLARRLKLQHLAVLDKVIREGSLLAASHALHMTQPALSKVIQELESHFDQQLLVRTRRGVQPTDFGRLLQTHSQSLLGGLRLLADDVNAWNSGVSGQVVVGSLISASTELLPEALLRLREMAPDVNVEVRVGVNETMFEALTRGELDMVVGLLPPVDQAAALEHKALYEEGLCAVVGRQHPLAGKPNIETRDLELANWVLPTPDSEAMNSTWRFFEALNLPVPQHVVGSVSILTNLGLLMRSDVMALMPTSVARQFVAQGLLCVLPLGQVSDFGRIGYTLVKGRSITPAAQRMVQALEEVAGKAESGHWQAD